MTGPFFVGARAFRLPSDIGMKRDYISPMIVQQS